MESETATWTLAELERLPRVTNILRWHPAGASRALEIDIARLLR